MPRISTLYERCGVEGSGEGPDGNTTEELVEFEADLSELLFIAAAAADDWIGGAGGAAEAEV